MLWPMIKSPQPLGQDLHMRACQLEMVIKWVTIENKSLLIFFKLTDSPGNRRAHLKVTIFRKQEQTNFNYLLVTTILATFL